MSRAALPEAWALFGAAPEFERPIPVGQLYFPDWERYSGAMRGIFERQYYTNQGPLTQQFEARLQDFLGVRHAVCVTNATIGLLMAVKALELRGRVVVPAFTFAATAQALSWAGVEPAFCDIDPLTHQLSLESVERCLAPDVSAICAVNLWGGAAPLAGLQALAARAGVALYYDSAHAFGCRAQGAAIGRFGALEVFSFHATKLLSATEGGCLTTNDDHLAARLRNIRSSYGAGPPVPVPLTSNGRMSEAQAAIGLLSLDDFPRIVARNEHLHRRYASGLAGIPGLRLVEPAGVERSNYQYVVAEVDAPAFGLTRDQLLKALKAENINARRYFHPGLHRAVPYRDTLPQYVQALPATDRVCERVLQLPIGSLVSEAVVDRICARVAAAQLGAPGIRARMTGG